MEMEINRDEAKISYLAFDINSAKGCSLCSLEESEAFAGQKKEVVVTLLEKMLSIVVDNELSSLFVRHEAEFLGNETKLYIWFVPVRQSQHRVTDNLCKRDTYALQTLHSAARRSRPTNISIRYPPKTGGSW